MDPQPRNDDHRQSVFVSNAYHRDRDPPPHWLVTGERPVASTVVVAAVAVAAEDGVRLADRPPACHVDHEQCSESDLGRSLYLRGRTSGVIEPQSGVTEHALPDEFAAKVLVVPRSFRWRGAMWTALLGSWSDPR